MASVLGRGLRACPLTFLCNNPVDQVIQLNPFCFYATFIQKPGPGTDIGTIIDFSPILVVSRIISNADRLKWGLNDEGEEMDER